MKPRIRGIHILRPEPQPSTWRPALLLLALASVACTVPPAIATTLQPPVAATAAQATAPEAEASQEPSADQEQPTGMLPILQGRVLEEIDEQPLDEATIGLGATNISTTTDAQGWFQIDLGLLADPPPQIEIVITREGYQPRIVTLSTTDISPELIIHLAKPDVIFCDYPEPAW